MPLRASEKAAKRMNAEASRWVLRMRSGPLSPEERHAFDAWIAGDPRHAALYRQAERILALAPRAFSALPLRAAARRPAWRWILVPALAAAMLIALFFDLPLRLEADFMAGPDQVTAITLPDGSTIDLASGSAIAVDMSDRRRLIKLLRGEAYFTVARDPARPFQVAAAEGLVTALGTRFDIRMTEAGGAEVSVMEHGVSISLNASQEPVARLEAGQRLRYDPEAGLGPVVDIDASAPDWRSGKLVIEDEPLDSVIERLQQHTGTKLMILGEAVKQRRISGAFDISDPLAATEILGRSLGLKITRLGTLVVVLHG